MWRKKGGRGESRERHSAARVLGSLERVSANAIPFSLHGSTSPFASRARHAFLLIALTRHSSNDATAVAANAAAAAVRIVRSRPLRGAGVQVNSVVKSGPLAIRPPGGRARLMLYR